ncbi:MAG TPA: M57 family metalloprotease, partial [Flavisolibacter sp.]|nr:M57 family metalloprotease [Flavisolibacter sp.]
MKTFFQTLSLCVLLCAGVFTSAQVPVLNSYPSSAAVIFLDFDGATIQGTSWNGSGPFVCYGSGLTTTQITEIFNRVSEDYRPFTVNVTTDSTVFLAAPSTQKIRVVLTTSSSWYGNAGGVAYINSFGWGDNTPCFVFTALLNYNPKYIAEAASHEAGHTLGLRHQSSYDAVCNKTSEYNAGNGSGEIGWAPIMGVGYYRNMTLWNYGANPFGCTSYQDDLSVITGNDGIAFRTDDHAATNAGASTASFVGNTFTVKGVIEKPADVDAFKFTMASDGRFTLSALPYSIDSGNTGANIDLAVELLNNTETVIGIYNPSAVLSTSVDTQLTAGVYYLHVHGKGNSYAPDY